MIAQAPVAASESLLTVSEKIRAFIATAKVAATNGLTVSEFAELTVGLLRVVVAALDSMPGDGPGKKAWALEAVGQLFDALADKCVPMVAWPVWVIARPTVRSLVLMAAGGAIESLLPLVRKAST
jgi:hypothetical protein